jgi:hypothetical protein
MTNRNCKNSNYLNRRRENDDRYGNRKRNQQNSTH